ncbi:N-acetyltransferase, GNAT family [Nitrospira sp. KM1]|uniref:GNAT family N-acetyltransferase n=1 Tax=Nitrospira sp. KM1 TaxID=1936990 RepID=UPI0013A75F6B|nr:N-acetyltransferase [Nitrospira sp. KM1]BCA55453.1 N-acetyltransferase, GNAT family [Nitrospira sp. KM1]
MPPSDSLIIRTARPEDEDSIVTFSMAMSLETEGRTLDRPRLLDGTRAVLNAPDRGFFMVAENQGSPQPRLVGQLMITFEWSDWRNAVFWWIQSVYVDPAYRRRGVYRRMHERIIEMVRADARVCGVRLYVERDNQTAQTVYRRVGLLCSKYIVYEQDFVLPPHSLTSQRDTQEESV